MHSRACARSSHTVARSYTYAPTDSIYDLRQLHNRLDFKLHLFDSPVLSCQMQCRIATIVDSIYIGPANQQQFHSFDISLPYTIVQSSQSLCNRFVHLIPCEEKKKKNVPEREHRSKCHIGLHRIESHGSDSLWLRMPVKFESHPTVASWWWHRPEPFARDLSHTPSAYFGIDALHRDIKVSKKKINIIPPSQTAPQVQNASQQINAPPSILLGKVSTFLFIKFRTRVIIMSYRLLLLTANDQCVQLNETKLRNNEQAADTFNTHTIYGKMICLTLFSATLYSTSCQTESRDGRRIVGDEKRYIFPDLPHTFSHVMHTMKATKWNYKYSHSRRAHTYSRTRWTRWRSIRVNFKNELYVYTFIFGTHECDVPIVKFEICTQSWRRKSHNNKTAHTSIIVW